MLAKHWKKIGMIILIVACIFNIMSKLITKLSLDSEILSTALYTYEQGEEKK